MEAGQFEQYQAISKLYKEIVDAITSLEPSQAKLFLLNLQKRIDAKNEKILEEYSSVKQLLDSLKEAKGKVPLHFAVARGELDIVRYMIDTLLVDFKIKDKEGNSPFFTAIEHNHLELVRYFVEEKGCSVNQTKPQEISTLHLAANHNHVSVMEYLIEKGADVEKMSAFGKPINWAVGSGCQQAVQLLIQKGANPDGDSTGSTVAPLIIAIDMNQEAIYNLLITRGANINIKDPNGYSALHLAAEKGELKIVKDLVQRGADLVLEVQGKTPLYLAFEHGKWEVVSYLKQRIPEHESVEAKWREETLKMQAERVEPDSQRAEQIKNIGNKFYAAKQYDEALCEYFKALSFDQNNEVIHRNMAACYLSLNQFQKALLHCKQARGAGPKNVKTCYRESQAYVGLNNLVDAASSMWECCMLEPNNKMFRQEFQKLVEKAKQAHQQQK